MDDNNEKIEKAKKNILSEVTYAGKSYFVRTHAAINLFIFIIHVSATSDEKAHIARLALAGTDFSEKSKITEFLSKNPGPRVQYLRSNSQLLLELFVTRLMDNFNTYLSDIVGEAFKAKPEILRYKETVRLDQLMKFDTIESFLQDLIDQEVTNISFLGFAPLEEWLQKRMGLKLTPSPQDRDAIIEFIETRNVFVHNHGVIGHKYLNAVRGTKFKLGEYRKIDVDYLHQAHTTLGNIVSWVDVLFSSTFNLAKISLDPHLFEFFDELPPDE